MFQIRSEMNGIAWLHDAAKSQKGDNMTRIKVARKMVYPIGVAFAFYTSDVRIRSYDFSILTFDQYVDEKH